MREVYNLGITSASRIPLSILSATVLVSCSGSDAGEERFSLTEENGVSIAFTSGGPLFPSPVFTFDPVLTLREDPAQQESYMTAPRAFVQGPDGNYYVPDVRDNRIVVFDSDGNYLRSIGRDGEGPGEFRYVLLQSLSGDTLSIFDYSLQRTTRILTDGTIVEIVNIRQGGVALGLQKGPGDLLLAEFVNGRDLDEGVGGISEGITILNSVNLDTVATILTRMIASRFIRRMETEDGPMTFSSGLPFAGSPTAQYIPGKGILSTDGDKPEMTWYDLSGKPSRTFRIDLETRPVSSAVREAHEQRWRENEREYARERGREERQVPEFKYPDNVGFWTRIHIDDRGYIWLLDVWENHDSRDEGGWVFHVMDPEGRYLGTARLPATMIRISNGRLMTVVTDPDTGADVPTVFQINSVPGGPEYN